MSTGGRHLRIYLIRHPRPNEAAGRCYGRENLSVDPECLAAAAASVRARIPPGVIDEAEIFTSPFSRCLLLARELAAPRLPRCAEDLLEIDFGNWEGKTWDSIPRYELDAWAADLWRYRPGGGESAAMMAQRWRRWSKQIQEAGRDTVVAVTHAGFIRVALASTGGSSAEEFAGGKVAFGSVHHIAFGEQRAQACVLS